ncbi:unnamed protein product [Phytophthora lilii]|uniref:Unnamed protein product n=1 Tax=Phytophthora lilii TaxID=2077276 RepID=A0A9W7CSZ7_9STRA|nr:unnamed protein product [Phytophthora lilii]
MKKFQPVLPAREDQRDFVAPPVANPTTASFAEGDPACMRSTLRRCKEERVTVGGAMVAAITLAFSHVAKEEPTFVPGRSFKLLADMDYNMRERVPYTAKEAQLGYYVGTSDANISNIGRYPYAKEFLLSPENDKRLLAVKSLHVFNPIPHLGPSAAFWVSPVDSFSYAMGHKCKDDADQALFAAWVKICEPSAIDAIRSRPRSSIRVGELASAQIAICELCSGVIGLGWSI